MRTLTYGLALTLMIGWVLWIGKPVLLPVLSAIIAVYVLLTAAASMGQLPVLGRFPNWALRAIILLLFTCAVILLFVLVINNLAQVAAALPRYETNLDAIATQFAGLLRIENEPTWENLRSATLDRIDMGSWVTPALLSLQDFGVALFLVVLYASFIMAERGTMAKKVVIAMGGETTGERALSLLSRINERVGEYLFVKTVLNVLLGGISYAIMLVLGIEFALFWAVLIAFLNYIPYFGSIVGVVFPVLLSLAQFGSLWMSGVVLISLTTAQMFIGAYLEPRMMGRAFNLSPFVVLLALAFWSTLWGLAGALLAVPMTASLVMVLAEIKLTRPVAILLSASGRV
ncbi:MULTISPECIES: AI-2E family transporter [Roseivivax]|nr:MULTISPECIES: AI-2E family transporter [Roseivivax]